MIVALRVATCGATGVATCSLVLQHARGMVGAAQVGALDLDLLVYLDMVSSKVGR